MKILFWFSAVGCIYSYLFYPLILVIFSRSGWKMRTQTAAAGSLEKPSVTVIVTIRNESAVIRAKLENTLALTLGEAAGEGRPQIIVASDGSDDGSDEIVKEYAARGVELVSLPERGGKEKAQREALQHARGEIIVFTDAKIQLEPAALETFRKYFEDPSVGAVSSFDVVEDSESGSSGEGFYVRYEMWLRSLEADFHSLVGLSGSCFAVRREICEGMRVDIPSDFALLIAARQKGFRGVHAADVVARYKAVPTAQAEFTRKVRTVLRGISTLLSAPEVMNISRYGAFAWQIISHKLCRWLVPWFMILAAISVAQLSLRSWQYAVIELLMIAFVVLAIFGLTPKHRDRIYCKAPLFFLISNAAIAVAWVKYFLGERAVVWNPSDKAK